jgi:hypothetical protein
MNKRFILILLLVVVSIAVVMAVIWRRHSADALMKPSLGPPSAQLTSGQLAQFGLVKGITPQEVQDATNTLVQERRMWSQFKSMSAGMNVEFDGNDGQRLLLEGNVSLQRVDGLPPGLIKFNMAISDKRGGWTVKTDGTSKNTVITCQDPQMSETIKTIGPESILHALTFPYYVFSVLYKNELFPRSAYTFAEWLERWEPYLIKNGDPHTYAFFYLDSNPEYRFKNGHVSEWRWRDMKEWQGKNLAPEEFDIYFENPVESNDFWYPTVFRVIPAPNPWPYPHMYESMFVPMIPPDLKLQKGQLSITLSSVSVNRK